MRSIGSEGGYVFPVLIPLRALSVSVVHPLHFHLMLHPALGVGI